MKRLSLFALLLVGFAGLQSCGEAPPVDHSEDVDLGTFKDNTYTCKEIGWKMEFPESWNITDKTSLENLDKQSRAAAGVDEEETSSIKRLLAFQKDFNNNFQSTIESFSGKNTQDYENAKANLRFKLYDSYFNAGTRVDTLATQEKISNTTLDVFQINLYDRTGKAYAHQLLYSAVIKGYYFSAIISYNNDKDKEKILGYFKKSTFN